MVEINPATEITPAVPSDPAPENAPAAAETHRCPACFKEFTSANNLERHLESMRVCAAWIAVSPQPVRADHPVFEPAASCGDDRVPVTQKVVRPAYAVLTGTMIAEVAAVSGTRCVSCGKDFATTGSLARHYKNSVACDRTRARDIMAALRAAAADFEGFVAPPSKALQDTGLPELEDALDPFAATRVIPGPELTELPAPIRVRG